MWWLEWGLSFRRDRRGRPSRGGSQELGEGRRAGVLQKSVLGEGAASVMPQQELASRGCLPRPDRQCPGAWAAGCGGVTQLTTCPRSPEGAQEGCGEGGPPSVVKGPLAAVLRTGRTGEEAVGLLQGLHLEPGVPVHLRPCGHSGIP